jgi:primosomal protein N' (replication factor Y)
MYQEQMEERQLFHYPPFYRIITVSLKHRQPDTVEALARDMAQRLRSVLGERVLGPDKPAVARIQLLYIRNIVIKIENNLSLKAVREHLLRIRQEELMQESFRSAIIYYDVDPM